MEMKNLLLIFITTICFSADAQNFEKSYPYFSEAYGDIAFVHENGYTLAGLGLVNGIHTLYLIRTALNGDTLWTRHLDYGVRSLGLVSAVTDNEDNHYISFFDADSAGLVKFTSDWQEVWRKKFDDFPRIYQLYLDSENKLLLSASGESTCLMKLNNDGSLIWQSAPLRSISRINATAIVETNSGEIILYSHTDGDFGYTYPNNTIRVYSNMGILVDSGYVSPNPQYSCGIISSNKFEGHLLSLCYTGRGQNYLVQHETDGTIIRQKEIILPGTKVILYNYIFNINNEVVAIGNSSDKSIIIHGMNNEGDSLWTSIRSYSGSNYPFCMALCGDGGYIISGGIETNGFYQPYLLKTDPWGGNSGVGTQNHKVEMLVKVYPNPVKEYVIFETQRITNGVISVTDIYGREVAKVPVTGEKTVWDARGVMPGVYLYHLNNSKYIASGKLMIRK